MKFDEMTVIFQFKDDTTPTISINETMKLESEISDIETILSEKKRNLQEIRDNE